MQKKLKVILLFDTSTMYSQGFLRGITTYSRMYGPWEFYRLLPFYRTNTEKSRELEILQAWGADGIIADQKGHKLNCEVPEIVFGVACEKFMPAKNLHITLPSIITDNAKVAKIALDHLIDRGFRRFGFCGFDDMDWSRQREECFLNEVQSRGYECHLYKQPKAKFQKLWNNEKPILVDWLKSLPKPIGMMACSDDRGLDVIEAAKVASVQIPDQIAIIGVDNEEVFCSLSEPTLSSIALNTEKAGFEAASLLHKLMRGEKMKGQKVVIDPTHVVSRLSTDVLAIEDRDVAEAMRFIRQNAKKKIQVSDVVAAVGISRCALYKRFFDVRGHSLYQEITHTRMQQVALMLLETEMSVAQIASTMGDDNDKHIARVFRKEFGISPQLYRKRFHSV
jgi:LacI family transcriptional regulator